MADRAIRLAISLLSEIHWVEVVGQVDCCSRDDLMKSRRIAVSKVLAAQVSVADERLLSRVIEFLPEVVAFEPIPMASYAELADLLRNNLADFA